MAKPFRVDIVSPEKTVFEGDAVSLVVPAEYGYLGILAGHAPLVAHIVRGKITLRSQSGEIRSWISDSDGFIEVADNKVSLVVNSVGVKI